MRGGGGGKAYSVTAIAGCFHSADGVPGEMKPSRNHKHVVCRKCCAAPQRRVRSTD